MQQGRLLVGRCNKRSFNGAFEIVMSFGEMEVYTGAGAMNILSVPQS